MIKIKSYGSGSSGNCYFLTNNQTNIILECGLNEETINKILNDNNIEYKDISACITSHCHNDHSLNIKLFQDYGIKCYCTYETKLRYLLKEDNFIPLKDEMYFKIGNIQVMSFRVNHGKTECYGFIFKDKDSMKLFITDFMSFEADLSDFKVDEIFIECNYVENNLELARENNDSSFLKTKYDRQLNTHCSLENLITLLQSNKINISNVNKINLIHISKDLGNKDLMKNTIIEEVGIYTTCLLPNGEEY